MKFSILYGDDGPCERSTECFGDLKLDKIMENLGEDARDAFQRPLHQTSCIRQRWQIMDDFAQRPFREAVKSFADCMIELGEETQKLRQKKKDLTDCGRYLSLADRYCSTVEALNSTACCFAKSEGMRAFFDHLDALIHSEKFKNIQHSTDELYRRLEKVHFCMLIKNGQIHIRPYEGQAPIDDQVHALFSRFKRERGVNRPTKVPAVRGMRHIDLAILNLVSCKNKDTLKDLQIFAERNTEFPETWLVDFSHEVHFFTEWMELIEPLREAGLPFCTPTMTDSNYFCENGFDLALALEMEDAKSNLVLNTFEFNGEERILVVSGANQGGKTTFARMVGQAFYLASLGCPIPGCAANLFVPSGIYTHFNREESAENRNGQLRDDLVRLCDVLTKSDSNSLLIINEIFASTTYLDALALGQKMMTGLVKLGCHAVCVTFLESLAEGDGHKVSMVSETSPQNLGQRTFKIVRKAADGRAYTMQLVNKYHLSYDDLNRRLQE